MTLETPVWLQQGSFPAYQDRLLISALVNPGIPDGPADPVPVPPVVGDLAVTPDATTLSVDVAPGVCFINGTDQTRQGVYACRNTASVNVPLAARPASGLVRTDLVYAQVVDTSTGITGTDGWVIAAATGVPAGSNPVTPTLPNSALVLARVNVNAAGGGTFVAGDITDLRARATSGLHAPLPILVGTTPFTANSGVVGPTPTAIPGFSLQFTARGGRRFKTTMQVNTQCGATPTTSSLQIRDGVAVLATATFNPAVANGYTSTTLTALSTPTAGLHVHQLWIWAGGTGTISCVGDANGSSMVLVEDIG
jgi:hypothetical protein